MWTNLKNNASEEVYEESTTNKDFFSQTNAGIWYDNQWKSCFVLVSDAEQKVAGSIKQTTIWHVEMC